ncbi:MAG: hypothetical protein IKL65_03820 [Bacilli bacterium]|nr:hypothetical protein [Bacilli bacterium]
MIIGIDIDDTLVNSSDSFDKVIKKYNVDFKKSFRDTWTEEEKNFIFANYLDETLKNAVIMEDAKEVINYLNSIGHKPVIITARNNGHCKNIEEFTRGFIEKEGIKISGYYFGEFEKSDIAKKINLDLMIDDNIRVYNNMKKENIDCILYGDKIKNWKEVLEYIKRKERSNG